MTREREIADLLLADAQMVALLPGGIYTDEEAGVEGIRRGEDSPTNAAFDENGFLLACALVRQSNLLPLSNIRSLKDRITATEQMVYIFFYERRGHSEIDAAKQRAYEVLEGARLSDSYPIFWTFETAAFPDMGPVMNSTALRQDWVVYGLREPA